jgi:hypothetical protein
MTPTPVRSSPWQYDTADNAGRRVHVDIFYNTTTLAIINPGLTGTRDAGCLYATVQIGRDPDIKTFPIPEGSFSVTRTQLANQGFATIDDVQAANFTLGF